MNLHTALRSAIEGKRFLRVFREDCAFDRVCKWDDGFGRWMAQIPSGPLQGSFDVEPVNADEIMELLSNA
jgi:hypothetical protein